MNPNLFPVLMALGASLALSGCLFEHHTHVGGRCDRGCDMPVDAAPPQADAEPVVCEAGDARPCAVGCFVGVERCVDGAWQACAETGARCDDPACAEVMPEQCAQPVCDERDIRPCAPEDPCFEGVQGCADGAWQLCERDWNAPRCDDPACDQALIQYCPQAACAERATRPCVPPEDRCYAGVETCVDGRWDSCIADRAAPSCDDPACAEALRGQCDQPCDEFDVRECQPPDAPCLGGLAQCINGRWQGCAADPRRPRCGDPMCAEELGARCEDGPCEADATRPCMLGNDDLCHTGQQVCVDGRWGRCGGVPEPACDVAACASALFPACPSPTVGLYVWVTWRTPADPQPEDDRGADVDLHLLHPGGAWHGELDCFFRNPSPDWGRVGDLSDNPDLELGDNGNRGPEAIRLRVPQPTDPLGGPYRVGVQFFRAFEAQGGDGRADGDPEATHPTFVTVTAYIDDEVVWTYDGPPAPGARAGEFRLDRVDDMWVPFEVHWPGDVITVDRIE